MASDIPKNSGGIPGFKFMSELANLVTTGLAAQAKAVNQVWENVLADKPYDLREYTRDVAKLWQKGFGMVEDLTSLPLRFQQGDRPPWFSLVWDRKTRPDVAQGEITLPKRLELADRKLGATRLERLGPDKKDNIELENVKPTLDDTGTLLSLAITDLATNVREVGHFVGFITLPNAPQPIAIIFLTVV